MARVTERFFFLRLFSFSAPAFTFVEFELVGTGRIFPGT